MGFRRKNILQGTTSVKRPKFLALSLSLLLGVSLCFTCEFYAFTMSSMRFERLGTSNKTESMLFDLVGDTGISSVLTTSRPSHECDGSGNSDCGSAARTVKAIVGSLFPSPLSKTHTPELEPSALPSKRLRHEVAEPEPIRSPCNTTTSRIVEHRERRWGDVQLSEFLTGPGLNATLENRTDVAACEFVDAKFAHHFPHAMEQLYRCWSFWKANPEKKSVLVHPEWSFLFPQPARSRTQSMEILRRGTSRQFFRGMLLALLEVFNVQTTTESLSAPLVRSNATDGFWNQSFAFQNPTHAHELADDIISFYRMEKHSRAGCSSSPERSLPRIGILNRDVRISQRSLLNEEILANEIEMKILKDSSVSIMLFENKTFLEQVEFYASVDIVISPHGAQLTGLPFMPQCGAVIEMFPMGYYFPQYFGSLAWSVGLDHQSIYVSEGDIGEEVAFWMQDLPHRRAVRQSDICASSDAVLEAVRRSIEAWSMCCDSSRPKSHR